ncbi:hypothetical protein FKM82_022652 [Ascaphus truei]
MASQGRQRALGRRRPHSLTERAGTWGAMAGGSGAITQARAIEPEPPSPPALVTRRARGGAGAAAVGGRSPGGEGKAGTEHQIPRDPRFLRDPDRRGGRLD